MKRTKGNYYWRVIAVVAMLMVGVGTVPVYAADPTTIPSSIMVFEGTLTANPDGTYSGTVAMADEASVGGGDGLSGFDVYARDGAKATYDKAGGGSEDYACGTVSGHDAYTTSGGWGAAYDPDVADWYNYQLKLDGDAWYVEYNGNVGNDGILTGATAPPMSGRMDWENLYASESGIGAYYSGMGTAENDGEAMDNPCTGVHWYGRAAWDMDWSWGSEYIPLQYPGFDVAVQDKGGGVYRVTLTPGTAPHLSAYFTTRGTGTADWSTDYAHSGTTSAKLATITGANDLGARRYEFAAGALTLDDLTTLGYWEYITARETGSVVDIFMDIWLDCNDDGVWDSEDVDCYMQAEPYYTSGTSSLDTWTSVDGMNMMWSTYVGPDDPYHAPTIYHFQEPATFPGCVHGYDMDDWTGGVDFGPMSILVLDVRVGYGGPWDDFTAYADDIQINEILESFDPSGWIKHSGNPLVTGSIAFDPSVMNDGGTYKMWYTHVDSAWSIYYATSSDGITWTGNTQVLTVGGSGAFDENRVIGPTVIKDGATYKMWYAGQDSAGAYTIGYATSPDGTTWTKSGSNPVLDVGPPGSWESAMVREPWVIKDGATYKMWYEGAAVWPQFQIGYATSTDGIAWTKQGSNPIFSGTASGWDGFQVYGPSVVLDGGTYHMYYSGTDNDYSQRWSTGYATSTDGVAWTKATRNPVLIPDVPDDSADYVSVMNDGGTWKMWYSYGGNYAIGLATQTSGAQLWLDPAVGSIPNDNSTTKTYTVNIANAANMYGFQFVISFDQTNLEATAAAWDNTFFSTPLGSPSTWDAYIDNTNGKVYFARTRQNPQTAVYGSGPLATVTFRSTSGAATGPYKLDFEQNKLSDIDGTPLSHTTQYAWLSLYGTGNLQGTVDLQGRGDESGGTVSIVSSAGYSDSTSVAANGSWSFAGIPAASYQVNVEMARYLDGQKGSGASGVAVPAGGTTTLNQVKLLGGDANDTIISDATTPNPGAGAADVIDIGDATIIGGQFGLSGGSITDIRADINADVAVDILDLSLMGGNYTKVSPVPWP